MTKVGIIQYPGSNCEFDTLHILKDVLRVDTDLVWHKSGDISSYDAFIIPGGFSYGDYLRAGAIASKGSIIEKLKVESDKGKPILGICNGFQILVEAGLLPGSILLNSSTKFICRWIQIRMENEKTTICRKIPKGALLKMPIAHKEGRYYVDKDELLQLRKNNNIVFRYVVESKDGSVESSPNGATDNIAGICNDAGNILGMMPHPERASEPILDPVGSLDGLKIFRSFLSMI